MRIAVCTALPAGWPVGGQQIELAHYAAALEDLGHTAHLAIKGDPACVEDLRRRAGLPDLEVAPWEELPVYDLLVSGYTWLPLPRGVPVISWWIDPYVMPGRLFGAGRWPCPWEAYPELVDIWTLSRTSRVQLFAYRQPPPTWRDIAVIPAPLDLTPFAAARRPRGGRDIDLIFVGRDCPGKGADLFVRVVEELGARAALVVPDWRPNTEIPQLKPTLEELPNYAVVDPPRGELAALLGRARALVLPTANEVAPLVAYEALAAGCPVVATAVGSLPEQVGPWGALVAPPPEPEKFVRAAARMLATPVPHEEVSRWALARYGREHALPILCDRLQRL